MRVTGVRQWIADFGFYNAIYVRIETDEGVVGEAEVAMRRRTRSVAALIEELSEYLIGRDPTRIEQHAERMYRDAFLGGTLLTIGISAIDQALWDLNGRALGVPVHRLLGGKFRDRVPVYTHAKAGGSPEELAAEIRDRVDRGFTAVKTTLPGFYEKVTSVKHDRPALIPARQTETELLPTWTFKVIAEYFAAAREAVGPDVHLMLDCHGRLNVANAIRLCEALAPYDLTFIEEPVPADRVDWMLEVSRRSTTPIAAGERWGNHFASAPFIGAHAVAVVQPDVGICGGITAARKIATCAEVHGLSIAFHNPFGPLQSAATWQLAATLPNLLISESMITPAQMQYWERYTEDPPRVENGEWVVTDAPGLGPRLRVEEIVKHPFKPELDRGGTR
ncbi:galactonate dehydratase [Acrocarpospora macrocephala]|uniref:Galactonate dehydratase n=1 Tax=Acrocarpospora macrocephala TaxID=150177 RepID=A0A5M3X1S9_9ACTN|nr:mandelate racemase/muconate lactonizing enzyme family protein [Acrocarpospora macrocephala]GES15665.1 galactonate dehydratase [Acrocarpospora macrocephala]